MKDKLFTSVVKNFRLLTTFFNGLLFIVLYLTVNAAVASKPNLSARLYESTVTIPSNTLKNAFLDAYRQNGFLLYKVRTIKSEEDGIKEELHFIKLIKERGEWGIVMRMVILKLFDDNKVRTFQIFPNGSGLLASDYSIYDSNVMARLNNTTDRIHEQLERWVETNRTKFGIKG